MSLTRPLAAALGVAVLAIAPAAAQQAGGGPGGRGTIFHTAAVGSYGYWLGQGSKLPETKWGYGATVRYLPAGMPFGLGFNWMRNRLDISGTYRADGHVFNDELTMERLGGDLYYQLEPNARGNVPYLLAGGGTFTGTGDVAAGGTEAVSETFWEAGLGIINGGSSYTAFALELKYIGAIDRKIRNDDGIIELSMSVGYNW
jgi:hypothetical protein